MQQILPQAATCEVSRQHHHASTQASSELSPEHVSLLQDTPEEQPRKHETRLKYRKLKQKLSSIGLHHDDKCFAKDYTSGKKQRVMKLALDYEKQAKVQNRDYEAMELAGRQILKLVQFRRELDLHLLRQSRFVPALFELLLKIPSLHKAELGQALRGLDISAKLLWIFASASANRQYLVLTNRLSGLISFGSWALGQEKRSAVSSLTCLTFKTINSLLLHRSREPDTNALISTTIQLILCSPLIKKIRFALAEPILDDALIEPDTTLELLRFIHFVLRGSTSKLQADYICPNQSTKEPLALQTHLLKLMEFLLQFCFTFFTQLKQTQSCGQSAQQSYPAITESAMLLTVKIANCCFQTALSWLRKCLSESKGEPSLYCFLGSSCAMVRYCKQEMEECPGNHHAKSLLNEIIILLAYLSLEDTTIQKKIYEIGLLQQIFNLPVQYIMDSYLRQIYIPTFCCLIHDNKANLSLFLRDNSPQPIIKLLKKEMAGHCSFSKKGSTTSLMSMGHISVEYSSATYELDRLALEMRFPVVYWESLCCQLQKNV